MTDLEEIEKRLDALEKKVDSLIDYIHTSLIPNIVEAIK